jgi:hypothetical protein
VGVTFGLLLSVAVFAGRSPALAAVGGVRAVLTMPFVGGGITGDESPSGHRFFFGGFAWDVHKSAGALVYANFASSDGRVSIHTGSIGSNGNGSGQYVPVEVRVNGTAVGTVYFNHLKDLQVSSNSEYRPGQPLGTLGSGTYPTSGCSDGTSDGWPRSSSWDVCTPPGIHTHLDVKNGCFRSIGLNTPVDNKTPILMLSTALAASNKSTCDNNELAAVMWWIGWIVQWDGDTKAQRTSWRVGSDGRRRWIANGQVYNCLIAGGVRGPVALPAATLDRLVDINGSTAPCGGDLNADGVVNIFDLSILLSEWGRTPGRVADIDLDGFVNIFDLSLLLRHYGQTPVPRP